MTDRVSSLARLFAVEAENDWRPEAACRGLDPELFFSSDEIANRQERLEREAEAKAVCTRCTVRNECLSYALAAGERYGIWGGLSPQERRAIARTGPGAAAAERVS
ncbi:MAG: WhiB family transcriptional regulator [Actinomycetota bacterium]